MSYRQQGYKPSNAAQSRKRSAPATSKATTPARAVKVGKPKRRNPFGTFILLVLFALCATGGLMVYNAYQEINTVRQQDTFYPGIFIDGIELHGAKAQDAYEYLLAQARSKFHSWNVVLAFGDDNRWTITPETLGMGVGLESLVADEVNRAYLIGRTGDTLQDYQTIMALQSTPYEAYTGSIQPGDVGRLDGIFQEIYAKAYIEPVNAERYFDASRNNPLVITPETVGRTVDIAALRAEVQGMANRMESGRINIQTTALNPDITSNMLYGDIVLLGNYATSIASYSTDNRNMNVERGCTSFQGKVVKPGEKVSFNSWVGKRTKENGFYEALEIVSGEYDEGIGGGICQVSSTLYNACIQAGLEIVSRTNHGIPISYVPMGADATVSDRGIDFVFRNNTGADLYLVAKVTGSSKSNKQCIVQIYGRAEPNGLSYSLKHETIEQLPIPAPLYKKDTKGEYVLYTDQQKQTFKGEPGYRVRTYLETRNDKGAVINEKQLYTDIYSARAPVIFTGVTPR